MSPAYPRLPLFVLRRHDCVGVELLEGFSLLDHGLDQAAFAEASFEQDENDGDAIDDHREDDESGELREVRTLPVLAAPTVDAAAAVTHERMAVIGFAVAHERVRRALSELIAAARLAVSVVVAMLAEDRATEKCDT